MHSLMHAWTDPAVRQRIRGDPRQYAIDSGLIAEDADIDIKVVVNASDTMYLPLAHYEPDGFISVEDLQAVQAAGTASTGGTVGSASTFSCFTGCLGTAGTAGSVACAGSKES